MNKPRIARQKLQEAIDRLADHLEYGHLLATVDLVEFFNAISDLIDNLKAAEGKK